MPTPTPLTLIGHRGSSAHAPENTAASLRLAHEHGAPWVEVDVRMAADGVLFLSHDPHGRRTTDIAAVLPEHADDPLSSLSWDKLRLLDAGSWFGPEFAGEPLGRLDDVLAATGGDLGVNLELKQPSLTPGALDRVVETLRSDAWSALADAGLVLVSSFEPAAVAEIAEREPRIRVGQLVVAVPDDELLAEIADFTSLLIADEEVLSQTDAERVLASGLELWSYVANTRERIDELVALGATGVFSDDVPTLTQTSARSGDASG